MKKRELKKIYDSKSECFKVSGIENKDFRGIVLDDIPSEAWRNLKMKNCIFDNTNATLDINSKTIENCSFKGCKIRPVGYYYDPVIFKDCDLSDTDIYVKSAVRVVFRNCKLSKKVINLCRNEDARVDIDFESLQNSPGVKVGSAVLINSIMKNMPRKLIALEEIESLVKKTIDFIKERDADGNYYKLIKVLQNHLNSFQLYVLFSNKDISNVVFDGVDFENLTVDSFKLVNFYDCVFKNCIFRAPVESLFVNTINTFEYNEFENNIFEKLDYHTFLKIKDNRFLGSPITFRKNLYVELGRLCNAKCTFCRNNSFDGCKFDIEKVLETLKDTTEQYAIDDIVLGGGEPTLFQNEIYRARNVSSFSENIYIFSNGSAPLSFYQTWLDGYSSGLNISRHAISDEENAAILGIKNKRLVSFEKIKPLLSENVTLCATCFRGGVRH